MSELYEQLNDLYLLHKACTSLTHGVKDKKHGWSMFAPSKFIYTFFAFNTFYSIDWVSTIENQSITNWIYSENNSNENKSETQKIAELKKFIYKSHIKDNLSKEEQITAKKDFTNNFASQLSKNILLELNKDDCNLDIILKNIVIDSRVTELKKNNFINSLDYILSRRVFGKNFTDALNDILVYVYLVRNNIFHGSKTVLDMMNSQQGERLKIYTAILLTVNELLFDAIELRFNWSRKQIEYNYSHITKTNVRKV